MCDWSAESVEQRDARPGDKLRTAYITPVHLTHGLVAPENPSVAVCLQEGMRVRVHLTSAMKRGLGLTANECYATFGQRPRPEGHLKYRDGLRFDENPEHLVLFQEIEIDVWLDVLTVEAVVADRARPVQQVRELELA